MAFLLMQTENALGREERVAKSAHEAELEAGVDAVGTSLMLRHQMVLDQIAMAVTLKGKERNVGESRFEVRSIEQSI